MSAWASLDGERIVSATVTIPRWGAWTADVLMVFAQELPAQSVLVLGDLTMKGAAVRAASFAGARGARLVAGAGGWRRRVDSRAYQNPAGVPLSMVLRDAAIDVGELVNVPSDLTLGEHFVREAGPASRILHQLVGSGWWIDPSGVTQIGARPGGAITSAFTVISYSGAKGLFTIAPESPAEWMPGRTFTAPTVATPQLVSQVRHVLDASGSHRLEVLTGDADRAEPMIDVARDAFPFATFFGAYEYIVQAVSTDGKTVDALPTDAALGLPGINRIPVRPSILGEEVHCAVGSLCVVMFLNGNPSRPMVVAGDPSAPPSSAKLLGGTKGVARDGDPVGYLIPGSGGANWSPTSVPGAIPISITGGSSKLKGG